MSRLRLGWCVEIRGSRSVARLSTRRTHFWCRSVAVRTCQYHTNCKAFDALLGLRLYRGTDLSWLKQRESIMHQPVVTMIVALAAASGPFSQAAPRLALVLDRHGPPLPRRSMPA